MGECEQGEEDIHDDGAGEGGVVVPELVSAFEGWRNCHRSGGVCELISVKRKEG